MHEKLPGFSNTWNCSQFIHHAHVNFAPFLVVAVYNSLCEACYAEKDKAIWKRLDILLDQLIKY